MTKVRSVALSSPSAGSALAVCSLAWPAGDGGGGGGGGVKDDQHTAQTIRDDT